MCLYETKLKNGKYEISKKNGGNVPKCNDYRQLYIKTGCGWCEECRKKLANDWRIRLYEEIKENPIMTPVTLTLSPEAITKIEKEIYEKKYRGIEKKNEKYELDVNIAASYAIKMWSERWRKKMKKSPKHWLITELGHKNSERLHLHGIVWTKNVELLQKTWIYGNVDIGKWIDERTINYMMKYVTKIDEYHIGYKQRIFASKGLGKCYAEKYKSWHQYKGKDTIDYYKTHNGHKIGLPRYLKEKIWTDKERENLWSIKLDENKIYLGKEEINTEKINKETFRKKLMKIREENENKGYGTNKTRQKKYIITEIMKKNKKEIINYNKEKLVKEVNKREIKEIKKYKEINEEIGKTMNVDTIIYDVYTGDTTEAERNYNELLKIANEKGISVKKLRLIQAGLIPDYGIQL